MKTFFAVCALLAASANAATCSTAELSALVADPNASACSAASNVSVSALTGSPTNEQLTSLCNTESCVAFIEAVLATNPPDCTLPVGSGLLLVSQLLDPIVAYCGTLGVDISAGSGASNTTVGSQDASGADTTVGDDSGSSDASTDASASASGSVGSSSASAVPVAVGASIVAALSVSAALM